MATWKTGENKYGTNKRSRTWISDTDLYRVETDYQESSKILDEYINRRNKKEWISKEEATNYLAAFDRYKSSSKTMVALQKKQGRFSDEDQKNYDNYVSNLSSDLDAVFSTSSAYATEEDYNKAMAEAKKYQAEQLKLSMLNLNDYAKSIQDLESFYSEAYKLYEMYEEAEITDRGWASLRLKWKLNERGFNTIDELRSHIDGLQNTYNKAYVLQNTNRVDPSSEYYDSEFDQWAKKGKAIENPSFMNALASGKSNPDGTTNPSYEIQNKVAFTRENWKEYKDFVGKSNPMNSLYMQMEDKEFDAYSALLAQDMEDGGNRAEVYLNAINETLEQREAGEKDDVYTEAPILGLAFNLGYSAVSFVEDLGKLFTNNEGKKSDPSVYDYMAYNIAKENNDVWGEAPSWLGKDENGNNKTWYGIANATAGTIGYMLPSILAAKLTGGLSLAAGATTATAGKIAAVAGSGSMGLATAGSGYQEMLDLGYNKEQAMTYGVMVGAAEGITSYALSGISAVGGKLTGNFIKKAADKIDNAIGRFAVNHGGLFGKLIEKVVLPSAKNATKILGHTGSEILEEEFQVWLEPWIRSAVLDVDFDAPEAEDMLYTALVTSFSTLFLQAPSDMKETKNEMEIYKTGKTITESGQAGKIAELAGTMDPDSATGIRLADYNAKTADGKTASPSYIGAVYRAMKSESGTNLQKAFNVEFENYISEKLKSAGLDADPKTVSAVLNTVKKKGLSLAERSIMKDKAVADVASSITEDALVEFASKQESVKKAVEQKTALETIDTRIVDAQIQNAEIRAEQRAAKKSVSKNVAEKGYTLENIAVKNSGELYVPSGNQELSVDSVALTQDTAVAVALSQDMNAAKKRAFFSFLRGNTAKTSLDDKHNAFSLVYHDGLYGFGNEHKALTNGILTEAEYDAIYSAGQNAAKAADVTSKKEAAKLRRILGLSDRKTGTVNDSAVRYKEHSAEGSTRVAIAIAKVIAATTGRNIELFDSTVRERMEGKENGKFDPDTNTLYIDVNAGLNEINGVLKAAMLPTLSHELVHLFAVENPTEYAILENLIFKALTLDGKTTKTALIDNEVRRIREGSPQRFQNEDGTEKSRETQRRIAAEEIVAKACEDRLSNSAMMKKFVAEMEKEDSGLVRKFRAALDRAVRKIREAVNHLLGQRSLSSEARKLAEQSTDVLDEIQAQFDKLLERNIGTEQTKENTSQGEVMMQEREKKVGNAVDKAINQKGDLGEKYNQVQISEFPADVSNFVSRASDGKINLSGKHIAISGDDIWHEYSRHKDAEVEAARQQLPLTAATIKEAVMAIYAPDVVESLFTTAQNPTQRQSFAYAKKSTNGYYIVVEAVGGKRNPNVVPVMLLQFTEEKWNKVMSSGMTLGELLFENDEKKRKSLDVKLNKKNRVTVAQHQAKSVATNPRSPQFNNIVSHSPESVKENDSSGVMMMERSLAKRRKNTYNEFNTNAMQWANSSSRNQNDVKVLYDPRRKQYYLIGVSQDSDMGFIELNSGTRLQMEKEMEEYADRIYADSTSEAFNTWTKDVEIGNRNNSWDNELPRHSSEERINGNVPYSAIQSGKETDGAGDLTGTEADSRSISYQERSPQKYSYEALTSKPDMKITLIDDISEQEKTEYFSNKGTFARVMRDIARRAKNKKNTQTTTYLHCADLDNDILISKESFKHGAARMDAAYIAVCKNIGSILENSIVVNELSPREDSNGAYVLLGLAESKESYILVRSIVNQKTWKLEDYNELYAIRKNSIKKEDVGFKPPHYTQKSGYGTSSVISISNFLEFVNDKKLANGVLSESVIENFGSQRNYREKVSNDLMFQEREYWYPKMTDKELGYVRVIAKKQANKPENHFDDITKWLYDERKEKPYFALYSTEEKEPTILYACKGKTARREYSWLSQTVLRENGINERRKTIDRLLVSFGNANSKGFVYYGDPSDSRIGNDDAAAHSQRKSKFRPAPALINCLENIAVRGENLATAEAHEVNVMLQDRVPYQSAHDVLMTYAEDAKNVKVRSKYLDEYVERSNALDLKYRRLEDAESHLAEAVAQGNEENIALYTNRVKTKQREIRRLNEDLHAMEESKELKAIVRREKAATRQQANNEKNDALHDYRDELERKARTERIMAKTKLLSKKLIANNRENHVPDALKEVLTDFLTTLEYHSPRSKRGGKITRKEQEFSLLLERVSNALRQNSAYQSQNGKMVITEDVYDEIQELRESIEKTAIASDQYVLDEMTSAELQILDRVMTKIVHGLNSIDRAFASSGRQEIDEEGKETMAFLDKMENQKGSDYKDPKGKKLSRHGIAKILTWSQFTPATAFNRLGESGKRIYRRIVEGWGEYAYLAKKILEFSEKNWKNNAKPFLENTHEIRANGKTYTISDAQLMYLYLADQREQGRNHLDGDGFVMPGNVETAESDKIRMSAEARQALYDKYIPEGSEARELARKMQKFLSENCAAWGNEVTLALYGYTAFTDENYVPLITDISGKGMSGNLPVTNGLYRILNMGFTKSLDPNAQNALIAVDIFDVFAEHAADMAKYKALGKPVLDAVRFFGYKETEVDPISGEQYDRTLQSRIRQVYGEEAYKYFAKFLEDLNGEKPASKGGLLGRASSRFLKNYKLAAIGLSFKTIVLQFTSYFRASYVLSGKSMTKAVTLLSRKEKKLLDKDKTEKYSRLAQQYSGMAAWKSLGYYDVNIARSLTEQIKGDATRIEKIAETATVGMGKADEKTLGVLFKACCIEVIHTTDVTGLTQEDIYRKAGELLDEVIVKTQVVDSVVTRSQAMRGDDGLVKSLTSFMSEPTVAYNVLIDAVFDVTENKKQGKPLLDAIKSQGRTIKKALISYAITSVAAAMVESVFDAWRDDEDEELWERWWNHLGGNVWENLSILGKIPFLRDGIATMTTVFGGYANTDRMEYAAFTEITKVIQKGVKLWQDDHVTYHDVYGFIKSLTTAASYSTSIPLQNVLRELEDLWNNTFGDWYDMKLTTQEPSFAKQYDSAFSKGKAKAQISELVGAKVKEYGKKYPEEKESAIRKKAESSVQSSLTRYYKPLYLEALEDSDREEMARIRSALRQSGLYEDLDKTLQNWIE